MTGDHPRIWVLLGPRVGDNNQLLALAEALGLPFETRLLSYNSLHKLSARFLGSNLLSLDRESRRRLQPPWPDLTIGIGQRSVPIARWLRNQSAGRTKLVRLGNPRIGPEHFDLVITTPQYPVPEATNVVTLPLAMSRTSAPLEPEVDEQTLLDSLPRPHLLLALGGWTRFWRMDGDRVGEAARVLRDRATDAGGSIVVATSQRTEKHVLDAVAKAIDKDPNTRVVTDRPRFRILLDDADEIHVTADSVSMLSEAIASGKPVGMIPIDVSPNFGGLIGSKFAVGGRDLREFWELLDSRGLVGTVNRPVASEIADPTVTAAKAVRSLLTSS